MYTQLNSKNNKQFVPLLERKLNYLAIFNSRQILKENYIPSELKKNFSSNTKFYSLISSILILKDTLQWDKEYFAKNPEVAYSIKDDRIA